MDLRDYYIELSAGNTTIHLGLVSSPIIEGQEALDGWYSTPDNKVEMTERQSGHGAHNVTSDMVLYSARTITLDTSAIAGTRAQVLSYLEQFQKLAGKIVKIRVHDGNRDTYANGFIETNWDAERWNTASTGTITIVCADPRRYSTTAKTAYLAPMVSTGGGLLFDDNGNMYVNPVQWYGDTEAGNSATLSVGGTTTAYPTITVNGYWPNGIILSLSNGGQLYYGAQIYYQNLILDCLTRTASINGVDVTRNLKSRDFPSIEPGKSLRISCNSAGNGGVYISIRDTYL